MKLVVFLLCSLLILTSASGLRVFEELTRPSPLFSILWRRFLLPCNCTNGSLDCSQRGKTTLTEQDVCEGYIVANLTENAFSDFPNALRGARVVDISHNELTTLPNASLLSPVVRELDLSGNRISNASVEFRSLASLEVLNIGKNFRLKHLRFLPNQCNLRHLDVSLNAVENLEGPLKNCSRMEKLNLASNKLTAIGDAFANMVELRFLDISSNWFSAFESNAFRTLSNLRTLNMKSRKFQHRTRERLPITTIPEGLFPSLTQLEHLSLSYNSLTLVSAAAFSALSSLKILDLSFTELETFPVDILRNLPSLEELNLSGNNLTSIPLAAFTSNQRLKYLDLNENNLMSLPVDIFSELKELYEVTIAANPMQSLPRGLFSRASRLKYVVLSYGDFNVTSLEELRTVPRVILVADMENIPARSFAFLPNLKVLLAFGAGIRSLEDHAFEGILLEFLLIEGRRMTNLTEHVLQGQHRLEYFLLYRCSLITLPEQIFSGLNRLKLLFLYNNQLNYLPERVFQGLHSLETLDLSFNNLSTLPLGIFSNLSSLRDLNLASNQLTVLPAYDSSWSSLQYVSFVNNPFVVVDQTALRLWLNAGSNERYLLLLDSNTQVQAESLSWLVSEPNVSLGAYESKRPNCGALRSNGILVRLCVVTNCVSYLNSHYNWVDVVRNSSVCPRNNP